MSGERELSVSPPAGITWSGMTHRGKFRANNEDAYLALALDAREVRFLGSTGEASLAEMDFVFAVSDGMGGAKSGEFASRIAVDKITQLFPKVFKAGVTGMQAGFSDVMTELYHAIHREMTMLSGWYEECAGMGATLSLCWFSPEWMYFGHIGDSRIYYLPKDGGMTQISHDDTYIGSLRRQGKLNEREARTHPRRNVLKKALGAGHQYVDPQVGAVSCQAGDRFLLCSDGLIDGLWDRRLQELIREPSGKDAAEAVPARRLITASLEDSGRDNLTALLVEIQ